mgnify:FL=1
MFNILKRMYTEGKLKKENHYLDVLKGWITLEQENMIVFMKEA